jgi:heme exporter protein D
VRNLDFSSWQAVIATLIGLAVITLVGVGIRLLVMQTVQQRQERENRQINERLRALIAAYGTLGGSLKGNLEVDPTHLRDLRRKTDSSVNRQVATADAESAEAFGSAEWEGTNSERSRRTRDAVEAALSDILLLGTEEQVKLAATVATELAAGRPAHTAELVVSLRDFIRQVLDLDPVPTHPSIPKQGPTRPSNSGGGSARDDEQDQHHAG